MPREQTVRLFTWDKSGKRVWFDLPYRPYYYVETGNKRPGDKMSLYNTPLRKVEFLNEYKRRESIDKASNPGEDTRLFENISTTQQFLVDQYWQQNDTPEFSQFPIKTVFVDIETYSPDKFPEPSLAEDTINVITVYDSIKKKFFSWGLGEYRSRAEDVEYINCKTERELLGGFVKYITSDHPDIISGWNSELFDIPYLVNRITKIVGEEAARSLSPINVIYSREVVSQFGKYNTRWHFKGVSCVDYLDVYKKFSQGLRESYKLDAIAEFELGDKKVDYGQTNLANLADTDWELFVDYNIQDVRLLVKMEEKLKYLELLRMLAYIGLTPFENAMGTLSVITGAAVTTARRNDKIIPTFDREPGNAAKYEGAYVGEPVRGFQDYIVSFDVNSLYPNIMISLNLSPETKMASFTVDGDMVNVSKIKGNSNTLSKKNFVQVIRDQNLSISKAKILFSQDKQGIFPSIVDNFYKERAKIRREMNKLKRILHDLDPDDPKRPDIEDKINKHHIKQFTIKIFINTVYGYFGNKHSPMGDVDISRSITLTGQAIIKQSNKILSEYFKSKGITDKELQKTPCVIYNDTDSVYITIKPLVDKLSLRFKTKAGRVTKEIHNLVDDIETHLNKEIKAWGTNVLNSSDCRFVFKRESICDVGLFLQKKRYILHVLDDEGIPVNKFKYTGVEVARTTMPKAIKPYVKKIIETMLITKDFNETNNVLNEAYDKFKSLPLEDIAFVMGISRYKTESDSGVCDGFNTYKGMPIHVKGAYYYNLLIDRHNLTNKYESIGSGDKVRYFYVKQPNKYGIKTMAYKYYFPQEFRDILLPDTELMFSKIIYSVVERLYDSVNWKPRPPGELVQTDLFELFKA